jgi:MFS family permease
MSATTRTKSSLPQKSSDGIATTERVEVVGASPASLTTDGDPSLSYGSGGLKGIVESPYITMVAFLASMGGFSFGYDQGVMSIINVMPQFLDTFPEVKGSFWKGFMTGMLELGACIGCLFMPWLADKISRKRAIAIVVVIFNVGAILQTAATNYTMLVIGRTIGGIGVGTLAMVRIYFIPDLSMTRH